MVTIQIRRVQRVQRARHVLRKKHFPNGSTVNVTGRENHLGKKGIGRPKNSFRTSNRKKTILFRTLEEAADS